MFELASEPRDQTAAAAAEAAWDESHQSQHGCILLTHKQDGVGLLLSPWPGVFFKMPVKMPQKMFDPVTIYPVCPAGDQEVGGGKDNN